MNNNYCLIVITLLFRDPSNTDYTEFEYPSTQAYTRLKTGEFEKLSYPYSSQAKILLAINSAAMNNAEVENKVNLEETTPAGISMSTEGNPKSKTTPTPFRSINFIQTAIATSDYPLKLFTS